MKRGSDGTVIGPGDSRWRVHLVSDHRVEGVTRESQIGGVTSVSLGGFGLD